MRYNPGIYNAEEGFLRSLKSLEHAIDRGCVLVTANILRRLDDEDASRLVKHSDQIKAARGWLARAQEYERVHGTGSMLVSDHPFNRDILPRLKKWHKYISS